MSMFTVAMSHARVILMRGTFATRPPPPKLELMGLLLLVIVIVVLGIGRGGGGGCEEIVSVETLLGLPLAVPQAVLSKTGSGAQQKTGTGTSRNEHWGCQDFAFVL